MVDFSDLSKDLQPGAEGIWFARDSASISYPDEGNDNCLALEADSFWFVHRNRCIQTLIRRFPPPGLFFDVGGGNGYVAMGLQQAGVAVALVEPGPQGAANARRRGVEHVICSTLEDAGFPAGSLPAVGLFDVLEHIADDRHFLGQVAELLAPGGRLYLTVPAHSLLWSADDRYAGHFRRYTLRSLRSILAAAGLRLRFETYIFWMLPVPIFLMRAIPSWLGLRKENAWEQYQQEHSSRPGLLGQALEKLLHIELGYIARGGRVPLGASCLVVAEKSATA